MNHCMAFSFIFQFFLLGSHSWYFLVAIDLFLSMKNPFRNTKKNVMYYHLYVWTTSSITSIILIATDSTSYRQGLQICWIQSTTNLASVNVLNWVLFFAPTAIYYFFSVVVASVAAYRLKKGLKETFYIRREVLYNDVRYVSTFSLYFTVAGVIYYLIYNHEKELTQESVHPDDHIPLYASLAVTIAVRAFLDVSVWFYNQQVWKAYSRWIRNESPPKKNFSDINTALRKEVLLYSTMGICKAVEEASKIPRPPKLEETHFLRSFDEPNHPHNINYLKIKREDSELEEVPFTDYCPQVFRLLRKQFHISDSSYKHSIRGKTESMLEKFTEGKSESFLYFSEDSKYIVKTLTIEEAKFLLRLLERYTQFMSQNPDSLICKFLGFHSIKLYNINLYFVVMLSVFLSNRKPQEKFDLKGSWISRMTPDSGGVGKDLNFRRPLLLNTSAKRTFLLQIDKDTNFLSSCHVMDYSLLLGIHYVQYHVNINVNGEDKGGLFPDEDDLNLTSQQKNGERREASNFADGEQKETKEPTNDMNSENPNVKSPPSIPISPPPQASQPHGHKSYNSLTISAATSPTANIPSSNVSGVNITSGLTSLASSVNIGPISPVSSMGNGGIGDDIKANGSGSPFNIPNQPPQLRDGKSDSPLTYSSQSTLSIVTHNQDSIFQGQNSPILNTFSRNSRQNYYRHRPFFQEDEYGMRARVIEGPGLYYFGIIDILQEYNTRKKLERFFKVFCLCRDKHGISVMPPEGYKMRFLRKMEQITTAVDDVPIRNAQLAICNELSKEITPRMSNSIIEIDTNNSAMTHITITAANRLSQPQPTLRFTNLTSQNNHTQTTTVNTNAGHVWSGEDKSNNNDESQGGEKMVISNQKASIMDTLTSMNANNTHTNNSGNGEKQPHQNNKRGSETNFRTSSPADSTNNVSINVNDMPNTNDYVNMP